MWNLQHDPKKWRLLKIQTAMMFHHASDSPGTNDFHRLELKCLLLKAGNVYVYIYIYNIYTYVYTVYIAYNLSTFSVKKYLMICRSTIHKHMKLKFIPNDIVFMISFVGSQWTPEKGWIEDELKNSSSTILNEWDSTNQTCCYGSTSSPTNTLLKLTWIHQLAMFEKQYLFQTLIFKIWAASGFSPEQKAA